jgi:putative ABC transport system permease protein
MIHNKWNMGLAGLPADCRIAVKQARRNAGFSLICILLLAFGLSVNTAVFSALYKVALKPLPYPKPEQLVAVHDRFPGLGIGRTGPSVVDYLDLREHRELFSEAGVDYFLDLTRTGVERPHKVNAIAITSSLFRALGVAPLMGRFFDPVEEQFHGRHAVIVSEAYWRSELGADAQILHRGLQLDGEEYPIVGVMPATFAFPNAVTQMWVPVPNSLERASPGARTSHYLRMYARLAPGLSVEQASSRIDQLGRAMAVQDPQDHPTDPLGWRYFVAAMARDDDGSLRRWVAILFVAVGCVLTIVCSNVAGLILARSAGRQFELSVRMALGASRARIARLVLMEVLLLVFLGGAGALLLAQAMARLLSKYGPVGAVEIEAPAYWFGLALTLAAGLACGLYPAYAAARSHAIDSLKQGGNQRTASRGQQRGRQVLIVAQVGIATGLLVCGGLLTHSLLRLLQVPLGFDAENVLTVQTQLHGPRYKEPGASMAFFRAVMEQTARIPGVDAASACTLLPFGYGENGNTFEIVGKPKPGVDPYAIFNLILPNYFATMRIPLIRGRAFTDRDGPGSEPAAIIDEALANRFLPGEDPIGKQIEMFGGKFTIVGEVGSVKTTALDVEISPQIYFPETQPNSMTLVIRSRVPQAQLVASLDRIVHQVDHDEPIFEIELLQNYVDKSFKARRFVALLMAGFAVAGALLAAVGMYALLSYMAAMRRREAGIRIVLGASPGAIAWLMCSRGVRLMAAGAILGSAAALGASRFVASQLYGTQLQDPAAWLAALGVIGITGLAASAIPAWRASRLDPAECLRAE